MNQIHKVSPDEIRLALQRLKKYDGAMSPQHYKTIRGQIISGNIAGAEKGLERVASYGMPVGREVFDTCEWIGRFTQVSMDLSLPVEYIFRSEEKMAICHNPHAGDANIRRALIDRFAKHDLKNGKGTKKAPDYFYGFKADMWAAFAVAYTYIEKTKERVI